MPVTPSLSLDKDRFFGPDESQKKIALLLYESVANVPRVCPHTHVDPRMFVDPAYSFGTPVSLLINRDHYVFRHLHAQGIPLERVGIPRRDGTEVEQDHRRIWQLFAENFHLYRGTPSGIWFNEELAYVFGVEEKLTAESAQRIYDQIAAQLATPEFSPRRLYERFNIEVLSTSDSPTSSLAEHQAIRDSGWSGRILPTFRTDGLLNLDSPDWSRNLAALCEVTGTAIDSYRSFVQAIEGRREFFKTLGATATDHSATTAYTEELSEPEAEGIFQRARRGEASDEDAVRFTGHMLIESARMSVEDGLVMQFHVGIYRSHDPFILERFGRIGAGDIPVQVEFTRNLRPLLAKYGNDPRLTLILFTVDETTYSRELAPLAGTYPTIKIGPPWWYFDSLNGMQRHRESDRRGGRSLQHHWFCRRHQRLPFDPGPPRSL